MVFSSLSFLYVFLPLCIVLYFLSKNRIWRNCVLLAFSVVFYAWGEPKLLIMMLAATLVAYLGGLLLHRAKEAGRAREARAWFIITLVLLFANLAVFKYFNFIVENIETVVGGQFGLPEIALPIGISFYTFQIVSYVIDLYLCKIRLQKNFFWLLLYLCLFPQLIAGPIVRYQTVEDEIASRRSTLEDVSEGLKRFIVGLAKKVVIANNVALLSTTVWEAPDGNYGVLFWWLAALSYTLQLYFDFSGYSDMAIGIGRVFGFHFDENFNYPYISRSITEFWRRWHISLSTWFRDYVYIPLGGNRVSRARHIFNILAVWALTGLWHGAAWNFVLWGVYYGLLLLLEKFLLSKHLERLPKAVRHIYTMFLVVIGWVLFSQESFALVGRALYNMFVPSGVPLLHSLGYDVSVFKAMIYLPLGIVCSLPVAKRLKAYRRPESPAYMLGENLMYTALFALCMVYVTASTFNPFIYFRF